MYVFQVGGLSFDVFFTDHFFLIENLTKVKSSMESLVAKKRNETQKPKLLKLKKSSPFPPPPVIIWIQQGT